MQGINFGMEGPNIMGWWVNPKTGDKFNAIDTFFEDNNLLIKTSDGRLLSFNQIQNYIQTKDPDSIPSLKQQSQEEEPIPAEVLNEIDNGDDLLIPDDDIYGGNQTNQLSIRTSGVERTCNDPIAPHKDFDIIDRALGGKSLPMIKTIVEWPDFPKRELEMLIDVMNISEIDIIMYYINKISLKEVKAMAAGGIESYITSTLHGKSLKGVETAVTKHEKCNEDTQKTINKKTTTKKK